jgi:hypothetical protein
MKDNVVQCQKLLPDLKNVAPVTFPFSIPVKMLSQNSARAMVVDSLGLKPNCFVESRLFDEIGIELLKIGEKLP